jgi:acetyltransferase-like isoleucine patch superfamily enzyme
MPFIANPTRKIERRGLVRVLAVVRAPVIRIGLWAGFPHVDYAYVHGDVSRVHVGERCSTTNTVFNVASGEIWIGDDTLFSHGCYVLTGTHRYHHGRRAGLVDAPFTEVPRSGNDIRIGRGCFVGANATILANVTIGDDCVIGAGSVVATDIPSGSFAAGVPAVVKRRLADD